MIKSTIFIFTIYDKYLNKCRLLLTIDTPQIQPASESKSFRFTDQCYY